MDESKVVLWTGVREIEIVLSEYSMINCGKIALRIGDFKVR